MSKFTSSFLVWLGIGVILGNGPGNMLGWVGTAGGSMKNAHMGGQGLVFWCVMLLGLPGVVSARQDVNGEAPSLT